jgi:putative transposase
MNPPETPHRKRCIRCNIPRHAHYLTFSCYQRRPFLSKDRSRQWFIDALQNAREKHAFDLWAWVIMPEHAHILIHPRNDIYSIASILFAIKSPVGQEAIRFITRHHPESLPLFTHRLPGGTELHRFWQAGGGYDRNVRTAKKAWEKIRYTHNNPVRRGLVKVATDWPWSSAADFAHLRPGPLQIDFHSIPQEW